ncbi:MAG: VanW family protein [Eubacteriales bacterium]
MEQIRRRKRRRRHRFDSKKIIILVGALFAVIGVIIGSVYGYMNSYINKYEENQVAEGIYLGEYSLAGMTESEVREVIEGLVSEREVITITLVTTEPEATEQEVTLAEFGFEDTNGEEIIEEAMAYGKDGSIRERYFALRSLAKKNVTLYLSYAIDSELVDLYVEEHYSTMVIEPIDAYLEFVDGGMSVVSGVNGMVIDIDTAVTDINTFMGEEWAGESGTIQMSIIEVEPDVTEESLADVKDELGAFDTYVAYTTGRYDNVSRASELINGTVIMPGEEISIAAIIQPFTEENGYAMAGSYENGEVVESMGGGICQVSSTVYNAVLRAELEVTQRSAHSMLVSYVSASEDAAIAGDYKDFKFSNNTDTPIYVYAALIDNTLEVVIYGKETRDENRTIKFESIIIEDTGYGDPEYEANPELELGTINKISSGHIGQKAQLWKYVYVDGVEQEQVQINSSTYSSSPETYEVGTMSSNAEASAIVTAAIESQDTDTINAAIAEANAKIQAAADAAAAQAAADAAAAQAAADAAAAQAAADAAAAQAAADAAAAEQATTE